MLKIRLQSMDLYIMAMQYADYDMAGKPSIAAAYSNRQTIGHDVAEYDN